MQDNNNTNSSLFPSTVDHNGQYLVGATANLQEYSTRPRFSGGLGLLTAVPSMPVDNSYLHLMSVSNNGPGYADEYFSKCLYWSTEAALLKTKLLIIVV